MIFTFQCFLCEKTTFNLEIQDQNLDSYLFNTSVLPDVQANLPEKSPFFVCPNGFGEHLFSNVYSTWDV